MSMKILLKILSVILLAVIFFFGSYFATMKLVVEPRYAYLTKEGVNEKIAALESQIAALNQQIAELEGNALDAGVSDIDDTADTSDGTSVLE